MITYKRMLKRSFRELTKNPLWLKVASLSLILFFTFLADAILSYWVPNFLEVTLKNTSLVGLVMGFSSVIGLLADLILPQVIKGVTVRKLVLLSIVTSFIFALTLLWATWTPFIILLLMSMAVWGIYYEFLGFATQQFVADSTPVKFHTAAWGIIGVFKSAAYFLGPILAGNFLSRGTEFPLYVSLLFLLISYAFLLTYRKHHDRPISVKIEEVNLVREFEHWATLFSHVWPVVVMSLMMGIIDASFWTVGAIWNEVLAERHWLGGMFLSFYILPSLFVGFIVAKWGVYKGKKKTAEKFLLLSGILFAVLGIYEGVVWQVMIVLFASIVLSLVYPLVDGVYSDITARMGRERKHMIGLSNSTMSVAYIIGPPLSGFIASLVGNQNTFVVLGISTALIATILLFVTPKKLLLPQEEINLWKD